MIFDQQQKQRSRSTDRSHYHIMETTVIIISTFRKIVFLREYAYWIERSQIVFVMIIRDMQKHVRD